MVTQARDEEVIPAVAVDVGRGGCPAAEPLGLTVGVGEEGFARQEGEDALHGWPPRP